ncbi:hypothetical protein R1sor_011428 [Riccia sorocarpa]|uniref:Uncharacterized protein n=1 Tax=Riccia sorocarpa TaxID=122646 RepID=A0ABD3I0U5_9MARC
MITTTWRHRTLKFSPGLFRHQQHHCNTMAIDIPSSNDQHWVDPVAIDIDNLLAEDKAKFESTRRLNPSVFRVPTYVRKLKPDAYESSFLPVGVLYDRKFRGMSSVYQLKLEVLGCFLELLKVDKDRWETLWKEVATQPPDSATPYLENFYENDGTYSFPTLESMQSHLVTDAFFIVGLFIWSQNQKSGSNQQPRFIRRLKQISCRGSLESSGHALDLDICWLYEGQIPLFLVKNAWEKVASAASTHAVEIGSFTEALKDNLYRTLMYSGLAFDAKGRIDSDFKSCDHLLACVHKTIIGNHAKEDDEKKHDEGKAEAEKEDENVNVEEENSKDKEHTEESRQKEGCFKSYICKHPIGRRILKFVATFMSKERSESNHLRRMTLPSATQLASTGIRFKCHDGLTNHLRFEKSFLSATLYLARISVADLTETMLLNMCVYESMNGQDEGIHNYVMLMNELIEMEEDVDLLMEGRNPIIMQNRLGDNKQIVGIFSNPVQNLYFVQGDLFQRYTFIRHELIAWYNKPCRRRVVRFLHSYRVAPWLLVSLLAAVFLLILTVLQTIYTIWGFYKS